VKTKLFHFLPLYLIFLGIQLHAQDLPRSENQINKAGKREGKWIVWLKKDSKPTVTKDSTAYYRELNYIDGKPDGLVKEFYLNGKTRWEGYLVTDQPVDIRNGKSISYDDEGNKIEEAQYNRIGRKISSKEFKKSVQGSDTVDLLYRQGNVNFIQSNFPKALECWEQGKSLAEKKFGKAHPIYASFLLSLSLFYQAMGNFEKAEAYDVRAFQIIKPKDDRDKANRAVVLGLLYKNMGLYDKAEPLLLQALQLFKAHSQVNDLDYLLCTELLGSLYYHLGNYEKAKPFLQEATQSIYGASLPGYTGFLEGLGGLYEEDGKNSQAEKVYRKSQRISKQLYGQSSYQFGQSLMRLGNFYRKLGKFTKADSCLSNGLQIIKNKVGEDHVWFADALNTSALLFSDEGEFKKAEEYYQRTIQIVKSKLGESNDNYITFLGNIARLYLREGDYVAAEPDFVTVNKSLYDQISRFFPALSEKEKEEFYEKVKGDFELFNAFALLRYPSNPAITGDMFNLQLATKALLLNSSAKWKQRIRSSGDKKLATLYYAWEDKQAILAKLFKDSTKRKSIDSLQLQANALEKELSQRSESFATLTEKKQYTWQDVQRKLKPDEAAIEIIRLRKFGISKIVTDSSDAKLKRYPKRELTDTVFYAALIVKQASKHPELIVLKNGNKLETQWLNYYRNSINAQKTDELSYAQFWEPIAKGLGKKIKKIYFSPDGVYNSINLNTLLNPKTKHYLLEEIDLQLLTTSKDLLVSKNEESYNKLAYLLGFPNYQTTKEKRATLVEKERGAQPAYYALNLERGNNLEDLPGTKTEVENIATMLSAKGWQPQVLVGDDALEETLKDAFKPRVLHIATHGYFQADSLLSARTNPLLQSGLMLTGAGRTLAGDKDDKTEDGILTAYEAMNLNLDNTDLVVLSACETGLGEIRNGEGVYGLQRAFKVAGAKSIIMSLWKVNDEATQQLITSFYQFWLESGDKRTAFKKAQLSILSKYPNPYYWGAFVIVGE
jgi:CHAT domain-containing protein